MPGFREIDSNELIGSVSVHSDSPGGSSNSAPQIELDGWASQVGQIESADRSPAPAFGSGEYASPPTSEDDGLDFDNLHPSTSLNCISIDIEAHFTDTVAAGAPSSSAAAAELEHDPMIDAEWAWLDELQEEQLQYEAQLTLNQLAFDQICDRTP